MKCIPSEFESNANNTGVMKFRSVKQGTKQNNKHVYIYERIKSNGQLFGYEVFIPSITKAGTVQKFPNGVTRTIEEDTENYPGASVFGISAYFCSTLDKANKYYEKLMMDVQEPPHVEEIELEIKPKKPKTERAPLNMPAGEFSVKELAEQNGVDYPIAFLFIKEQEAAGTVERTRTERRAAKGKETQLFKTKT
jgi:hypothetical protein